MSTLIITVKTPQKYPVYNAKVTIEDVEDGNTLKDYVSRFVSGYAVGEWQGCVPADPEGGGGWGWVLADKSDSPTYNCDGVIFDADGYNSFFLNAWLYNWGQTDGGPCEILVYESDTTDGPWNTIYDYYWNEWSWWRIEKWIRTSVAISKRYIKVQGKAAPGAYQRSTVALVIPSKTIAIVYTDRNGNAQVTIDTSLYWKAKIWAEKSINKQVLNMTAKHIADLREINIDV